MSEEKESKPVEGPFGRFLSNVPKPLRQPICTGEEISVASGDDKGGLKSENVEQKNIINKFDGEVLTSTLNVNAAEFIPYSQKNQCKPTLDDIHIYLSNELQCLALNPGNYDEILEALCEVLSPSQEDEEIMKFVINMILNECITVQNLRYSGVRLCTNLQKMFGNNFRTLLLTSCQEKFSNFVSNQDVSLDRICGFGLVLAELYLQINVQEPYNHPPFYQECITILGENIFDLLNVLLRNEGEKAIKCVCQILKLTGVLLEENSESSRKKMDDLFSRLQVIIRKYDDMDPNLRFTISNVIQLRDSNWGRNKNQQSSSEVGAVNANGYDEIVFYGPDGELITDEEKSFLRENLPSSDEVDDCLGEQESMDEEMFDDYEKFLKLKEEAENRK